jgi:proteasome lid subunit RPN8/RPN11
MKANSERVKGFDLRISCDAARQIRQHARASSKAEVCGVLIGSEEGSVTSVQASIPGANAVQGGSHVTFTQDTWEHIYRIKDSDYPEARIVGWYHSHPGFGVFLSDHDAFIHKNFFSAPRQVAWVYDPHSDEEGCFGWMGTKLERLPRIVLVDAKGGEGAGETGKPEPLLLGSDDSDADAKIELGSSPSEARAMLSAGITVLSYLCIMVLGFFLCWYFYPRYVLVPVDPRTGQILLNAPPELYNEGSNGMDGGNPNNPNKPGNPALPLANPTPAPHGLKGKP